ncbi:carboxypeptidase-like regulatory domain-containing protein [Pedobacter sp. L105]|uniref:carboxypeptidase-like regulatory domain-containing protein n=1 Tax=Pedobacter sp. L105 TaxID=1641871 RepID=UPI0020B14F5F|nr:carboxypeptidase-like regulatory domain-containing protein [Pedobacter sp. L105]
MAYRSDDDPFTAMLQKLKAYTDKYPQEKIHLHLDKPYYAAGDDIWFKAYVVNAMSSNLTSISGVLYVELIDESDAVRNQVKLPLVSGLSWGSFKLPDSFAAGNYRIRAYTQWMRNAGPDFFFDKIIKIGSRRKNIVSASTDHKNIAVQEVAGKTTLNPVDVQFFPEGGNFVEGQPNKLGIKAVNTSGLGEDISGSIVDNAGVSIATFSTKHLGMGNVTFTPKKGKTYTAKIKYKDGAEHTVNLPKLVKSGYVLSIDQNAENILVKVLISDSLLNNGVIKLAGLHNNTEIFVLKSGDSKQIISTSIPKKDLPLGIMQLTLFSPSNQPVCERLLFINNSNGKITTGVSSVKKSYAPKEETEVNLDASLNGKPVQGSFSVAVTNISAIKPDEENESNIFTTLLLTSDLTGYIEKPNYYFLDESEKTQQDLDNLMLTQGWRRVLWKNIINNENPNIVFQPEKSLKISGTLIASDGSPIAEGKVSVLATSGSIFKADTVTDAQGRFNFEGLNFGDNAKFLVQASSEKNKKNIEIKLDADNSQPQLVTKNQHTGDLVVNVNEAIASYLQQNESYFVEQAKRSPLDGGSVLNEKDALNKVNYTKNSANLNGAGNADVVISSDELLKRSDLGSTIEQKVSGLSVTNGTAYMLKNRPYAMMIVVDGFNVDSTYLGQLKPFNVQAVEILTSLSKTAIYGRKAALSGVLVITTKKAGDDSNTAKSIPGVMTISPKGYNFSKEFYSPVYKPSGSDNVPDHRSTIFWTPNVITSVEGKAKINYFNADDPGTYRVVVEGIDMQGNLSHFVYTYEVK